MPNTIEPNIPQMLRRLLAILIPLKFNQQPFHRDDTSAFPISFNPSLRYISRLRIEDHSIRTRRWDYAEIGGADEAGDVV